MYICKIDDEADHDLCEAFSGRNQSYDVYPGVRPWSKCREEAALSNHCEGPGTLSMS